VYIETYGCTLNQSDSDIISLSLKKSGYELTTSESFADAVVINTCTVKGATENKISERMKKLTQNKVPLVIAGCMSANERLIKKINPHAAIVGTTSITSVAEAINDALSGNGTVFKNREDKETIGRPVSAPIMRIPICEGCTSRCHFCQTKIARPFLFSYQPKTILKWVEDGIKQRVKEIQLTAMDAGVYGMGLETQIDLPSLLSAICETEGDFRVRLGMINPQHAKRMCEPLISALAHEKMYKFIHIPVQTGSERVCKEMNRQHTVKNFYEIVDVMRKKIPNITIATDIIVGYPTETKEDFEETVRLIETIQPDIVNISKFSPREGTIAKKMKQLPTQIVKKRSAKLAEVARQIQTEKNKKFIGKVVHVMITERQQQNGRHGGDYTGRTNEYKQVAVKGFKGKIGEWVKGKIIGANYGGLIGKLKNSCKK